MKTIEYYYNLIYYFFYRGAIQFFRGLRFLLRPYIKFLLYLTKVIPSVRRRYEKKGIIDAEKKFYEWNNNVIENPRFSKATIYGHGFASASLLFILMGFYKILNNLLYPEYEYNFKYTLITLAIVAYAIDIYLVQTENKEAEYINKFNNIKDKWWRIKWSIITALTFPLSITFLVITSKHSYIGEYCVYLHNILFH